MDVAQTNNSNKLCISCHEPLPKEITYAAVFIGGITVTRCNHSFHTKCLLEKLRSNETETSCLICNRIISVPEVGYKIPSVYLEHNIDNTFVSTALFIKQRIWEMYIPNVDDSPFFITVNAPLKDIRKIHSRVVCLLSRQPSIFHLDLREQLNLIINAYNNDQPEEARRLIDKNLQIPKSLGA